MNARTVKLAGIGATAAAAISTAATLPAAADAATGKRYTGAIESTPYGRVRVAITLKGRKITSVAYSASPDTSQSYQLEAYALPLLRQEVLRAQSYRVHTVSGVTITSEAFDSSLYSAMHHAHLV